MIIRKIWSGVLIFLLLYTATIMPYKIALLENDDGNGVDVMFYIDSMVDMLFLIDIMVNFNTPLTTPEGELDYN